MATDHLAVTRVCRKCGVEVAARKTVCKACQAVTVREYNQRYYAAHKERMLTAARASRVADPEFHRERDARYYREHISKKKDSAKAFRKAHQEKVRDWHRAWSKANPDKIAAYGKSRREKKRDAETRRMREWRHRNRDRVNEKQRAVYHANAEQRREYGRKWYEKNRERINALSREWCRKNRDKIKEWSHKRREANGSGIRFKASDLTRIFAEQCGECLYCASDISTEYEVDHFIPVKRGGGHEPSNIVLACMACNRSKGSKLPWEWMPERFPIDCKP